MHHVSHVTGHFLHVQCHVSQKKGQSGEASRWRIYCQRGLPRLVLQKLGNVSVAKATTFLYSLEYVPIVQILTNNEGQGNGE